MKQPIWDHGVLSNAKSNADIFIIDKHFRHFGCNIRAHSYSLSDLSIAILCKLQ